MRTHVLPRIRHGLPRVAAWTITATLVLACHRTAGPPRTAAATSATETATETATGTARPAAASERVVMLDGEALRPLTPAQRGSRLPDRLDDSTYWRTIRDLSEPGGYFQSENFVSNEMGLQHVIAHLETLAPPGGVYIGVGPEQNFTYLGTLRPRIAFIVDIRRQNLLQHLWYKAIFELSPTRAQFLSKLLARPGVANAPAGISADSLITLLNQAPADLETFRRTFEAARRQLVERHGFTLDSTDLETLRYVDSIFVVSGPTLNYSSGSGGRGGGRFNRMPTFAQIASATNERGINRGFLGTEDNYAAVRDMQRRNLIIPVVGDFGGPKALRAVGAWLRDHNARVNVFYTSNVEQYLFRDSAWERFYQNVGSMPLDTNAAFIRSATNAPYGGSQGFLMTQLTSSIQEIVKAAQAGGIQGYYQVLGMSRPD